MEDSYVFDLAKEFIDFIKAHPYGEPVPLSDYLGEWLEEAIEATGGNFDLFFKAFMVAAAQLASSPEEFGDVLPNVDGILPNEHGYSLPQWFDREHWEYRVFRWKYCGERSR